MNERIPDWLESVACGYAYMPTLQNHVVAVNRAKVVCFKLGGACLVQLYVVVFFLFLL